MYFPEFYALEIFDNAIVGLSHIEAYNFTVLLTLQSGKSLKTKFKETEIFCDGYRNVRLTCGGKKRWFYKVRVGDILFLENKR